MRRWLDGFAYRVDLGPLTFLAASGLALGIALITVSGHTLLVARSRRPRPLDTSETGTLNRDWCLDG
jgi:hypothetical protein